MSSDIRNWIKLGPSLLHPYFLTTEYMYIDREDNQIDAVLRDFTVGLIKFNKYEGVHPDHPGFKICMVKCFKWNAPELENAFRKLDWKLTLNYGKKYTDFRDDLFTALNDLLNAG